LDSSLPVLDVLQLRENERLVSLPPLLLLDARTGSPPRLSTALRVGLRGSILGVRFDGRDDGVVATYTGRDAPLWKEDVFEVFLAPSAESPTTYYEFEVNPLGTLFDARIESPLKRREQMRTVTEWDCPGYRARVTRREGRWSASLRIPLDELSLASGGLPEVWRANFHRIDRGGRDGPDEYSAWSPTGADPADFHVPERFGTLNFRF
jgi:hypothetical protein